LHKRGVVSKVEPGYLRNALPGKVDLDLSLCVTYQTTGSAPENGEDFQSIADDYQRLIIPGTNVFGTPSHR
jgi:aromatic-L-amino-acid decarboxylase